MKVFSVGHNGEFTEYEQVPFKADHGESVLEDWLEVNHNGILEEGRVMIIGRQVQTDLGGSIDLLGFDREGNVVVVELKRDRTPRDVVAQALAYAAYAERLDVDALAGILREYHDDESLDLAEHHRWYFGVDQAEAVAFNKDQRIVIIGQQVSPEIRQTALFLGSKGIQVTCVEFTFFQDADGGRLLSQEIVVGREHAKPRRTRKSALSKAEFLESCDTQGRAFFTKFLDMASHKGMSPRGGTTSFLVEVDVDGTPVLVCRAGRPGSKYDQAVMTALGSVHWGIRSTGASEEVVKRLWKKAEQTGLFTRAGKELRCLIDRAFTDDELVAIVAWCEAVAQAIREHGRAHVPTPD